MSIEGKSEILLTLYFFPIKTEKRSQIMNMYFSAILYNLLLSLPFANTEKANFLCYPPKYVATLAVKRMLGSLELHNVVIGEVM
jgi:hypothetical protein